MSLIFQFCLNFQYRLNNTRTGTACHAVDKMGSFSIYFKKYKKYKKNIKRPPIILNLVFFR